MAKKKATVSQKNNAKLESLLKHRVSGLGGFLKKDFKTFIAEELIHAANNKGKVISSKETLQKRYDRFRQYYDKLFTTGMAGHAQFTGTIEKQAKKAISEGTQYYIREKGKEKRVSHAELSYKMELLAHKLSAQHDVAFTKFKPTYYLLGKGKYKIVINIPDLKEVEFDEITTEEIMEYFDDENMVIVISDPSKIKNIADREKRDKAKKKRQVTIRKQKEKHYRQWKKPKKKQEKKGKKRK